MGRVFEERLSRAHEEGGARAATLLCLREAWDITKTAVRLRIDGGGLFATPLSATPLSRGDRIVVRPWLDDLRGALRGLARSPGFTLFGTATLALGVGATVAFAAVLDRIVLRPVDFPQADRLVTVWRSRGAVVTRPDMRTLRLLRQTGDEIFEALAVSDRGEAPTLSTDRGARVLTALRSDTELPALAGAPPILGRYFTPEDLVGDGGPVVILSEGFWTREFGGDRSIVGRDLRIDGTLHTVVGVAPAELRPSDGPVDVLLPLGREREARAPEVLGRLAPGVSLPIAQERLELFNLAVRQGRSDWKIRLMPVGAVAARSLADPLRAAGIAVGLLLLIACLNVANLFLARGDARRRETSIRAALGAGWFRLARETFTEGLLLILGGAVAGLGLATACLAGVRRLRPEALRVLGDLSLDPVVAAATLVISGIIALLVGMVPVLRSIRRDPADALRKRGGSAGRDSGRLRRALLVGEVALSFALLTGGLQLVASLEELRERNPGFASHELLAVQFYFPPWRFPEAEGRQLALDEIGERAQRLPGVRGVAVAAGTPPLTGTRLGAVEVGGNPALGDDTVSATLFVSQVEPGYFRVLGQEIVQGRGFMSVDRDTPERPCVLSASAARKYFPAGEAVGEILSVGADRYRVVGVARDVWATGRPERDRFPHIYTLREEGPVGGMVLLRAADPAGLATDILNIIHRVNPEIAVERNAPVESLYRDALARESLLALLLVTFAVTSGILAAVGLYGVTRQLVLRRTQEYGIRLAVGAEPSRILRMVLRGTAIVALVGTVCGGVLVYIGLGFLQTEVVGLDVADPASFAIAASLLTATLMIATSVPARRAMRVDPIKTLGVE